MLLEPTSRMIGMETMLATYAKGQKFRHDAVELRQVLPSASSVRVWRP